MIRPKAASTYEQIDLKLGIKSSLPSVKSTLALLFMMWKEMGRPAELEYSVSQGSGIALRTDIRDSLYSKLNNIDPSISASDFDDKISKNLMLKAQLEALIVALELVWKVAKIRFADGRSNSSERTGGSRYPKKLWYTVNMDIFDAICRNDQDYDQILFAWLGFDLQKNAEKEENLVRFLTVISESAYFKLDDNNTDVVFNLESIYDAILSGNDAVDIAGDKEAKGSLRILKSALDENLFSSLLTQNNTVIQADNFDLSSYAARVKVYHQLNPKVYQEIVVDKNPDSGDPIDPQQQKSLFREWMSEQKKANGDAYSENTISSYLSQIERGYATFEKFKDYESPFQIQDTESLKSYMDYLFNADGFEEFNIHAGNRACQYGFEKYAEFVRQQSGDFGEPVFFTGLSSEYSLNRILFGAPGTGKSFTVNEDRKALLGEDNEDDYERVTFHPDYSYANFVGTYKPVPCKDDDGKPAITYKYVPGPFMRIYVRALKNAMSEEPRPFLLIIEEINRAEVAAVFGDIFQLLDRGDDGVSEYPIQASEDIKAYLAESLEKDFAGADDKAREAMLEKYAKIRIPDNMFIWATMNSADQGVYPMDTAFKRRWDFTYLGIDDNDDDIRGKYVVMGSKEKQRVEWNALRKAINEYLAEEKINEDKQLGPYFIPRRIVVPANGGVDIDSDKFREVFKNKVLMYLFEDAAKQRRPGLFKGSARGTSRYSNICKAFDEQGIGIFADSIQTRVPITDLMVNGHEVDENGVVKAETDTEE